MNVLWHFLLKSEDQLIIQRNLDQPRASVNTPSKETFRAQRGDERTLPLAWKSHEVRTLRHAQFLGKVVRGAIIHSFCFLLIPCLIQQICIKYVFTNNGLNGGGRNT